MDAIPIKERKKKSKSVNNVIPDEAHIGLNLRTQSTVVQQQIIDAIRSMAEAEAQAFRASKSPEITTSDEVPLTSNCEPIDQRIRAVHASLLGSDHIVELPTMMFSEDFSQYGLPGRHHYDGEPIPYCYWVFGGHSQERYDAAPGHTFITKLPNLLFNHQANFAPEPESTLRVGVCACQSIDDFI
jgi:metal-dependent amidase/aminoacylase/carboxypeptidase family protein